MKSAEAPIPRRVAHVLREVAHSYGVTVGQIRSKERPDKTQTRRQLFNARHLCCYFLVRGMGYSLPAVAKFLGYADHTTVLYGVRTVERAGVTNVDAARTVLEFAAAIHMEKVPAKERGWKPPTREDQ